MKVCSLYGVGFYYVPGTDICLKVGAYFRAEYAFGNVENGLTNLDAVGDGQRTRIDGPNYSQRARSFIFLDTRQQTAYGTLRAYMNIGHSGDFPGGQAVYANRAFMQLAGFTWGLATSYYDFFSSPATSYSVPWSSDTGDGGWKVAAYTAQLGNGVSASLSFEQPRNSVIVNTSVSTACTGTFDANNTTANCRVNNPFLVGALPTADQRKIVMPDIVANVRVDQAWGSAQLMGAVTNNGGGYYGNTLLFAQNNGHPDDKLGFAVGAGIKVNFPMIGPGDYLQAQVNYTQGAVRYAATTPASAGSPGIFEGGDKLGLGWFTDAVFCGLTSTSAPGTGACPTGATELQLTTAWSAQVAYEHFWTPSLRTSLVGAYTDISYNSTASAMMCEAINTAGATGTQGSNTISSSLGGANLVDTCGNGSFDWSYWSVSSRTQWNITKEFYVGLEGYYGHLNTMSPGTTVRYRSANPQPAGLRTLADQDVFVYRMRVHRDLVP